MQETQNANISAKLPETGCNNKSCFKESSGSLNNSDKTKTFVFLQTHIITKGIINEYKKIENSGNADSILFINNLSGKFDDNGEIVQEREFFWRESKMFLF